MLESYSISSLAKLESNNKAQSLKDGLGWASRLT